jgi:hypothetical protein
MHKRLQRNLRKRSKHGLTQSLPGRRSAENQDRGASKSQVSANGHRDGDIEQNLRSLSTDQLFGRFHELTDKRLEGTLKFYEVLELERIEVLLDREDAAEMNRVEEFRNSWYGERSSIVESIEKLLANFKPR